MGFTIFHVAIVVAGVVIGTCVGRIFGHAYVQTGALIGFAVGFLAALIPYPLRAIFWLFDYKKRPQKEEVKLPIKKH